ncbi:AbrB/MazE/SpoVT family DNA-binding domain-containing protein [Halorussus sp. MSC15.2]|uniref:AbrB/MazE/SpoVT family DNA-binding domain-containing protein n=1 Tax=Halorussus sp. MSC15.2 TaxID=2283638 RepID=UPI0013D08C04|nr:AbrB/MazE/SpoVT family DNA-binding domain-containing protein [Halorussus sp. MSC15.2]NEU55745.1 AbrB/MazE/SpoVT family DNA-binding domain-containing protein [Halorussus sp. MSC15.2]
MSRVTSKGQVTIPKEVRERLGIRPGDEIEFEETDEGYVIKKEVEANRFEKWRGVAETDETVEERMRDLRGERE